MIPDFPTIARRRHIATMIVRSCIVAFAVWVAYGAVQETGFGFYEALTSGELTNLLQALIIILPRILLVACLFLVSGPLVRWIVPLPAREQACPKCGYSLKNLKSPICPECGTDLN